MNLPTGTVTFLFTDIEGSTRLWEENPEVMGLALARHDAILRQVMERHHGHVFKTIGDAFCVAFHTAPEAVSAAIDAQQSLLKPWLVPLTLKVRMALHAGTAEVRDNDYFGQTLNRVARLLSAGHGGQILISSVTQELVQEAMPTGVSLLSLGEHRLRDLNRPETVYQLLHPDLPAEFPKLKSLNSLANNLPLQLTSFIGREKEVAEIKSLLGRYRLLTLTGSGGCGKTRLSLQVAAEVLESFSDGAWMVELASLIDPALVPQRVAQALGIQEQAGQSLLQTLTESLKGMRLLLLLDNCEHLLSACAQLADALMRACPHVKILTSSREGLGIAGETSYRVPSLSLPDLKQGITVETVSRFEAVRLFIDRAVINKPDFAVTPQNAPALASICHRLDGIPLAIELGAARVRSLSVEEINLRLDNRFRLLTGGSKTALPRQQTLRALIDWSYDLLNAQEKVLLLRLSVFAGGWTLAAAEQIVTGENAAGESIEDWEVLDFLTGLADKSLVIAQIEGDTTRYRMMETMRQYARDRLAEGEEGAASRRRHRDYFRMLVEEIHPKLKSAEQAHWLGILEEEHDNLRQAMTFCQEEAEGGEAGLRIGAALIPFWLTRGRYSEGRERLTALLAHPGALGHTRAHADALNGAGILALISSEHAAARSLFEESLEIRRGMGDRQNIANSLNNLGVMAKDQGDYASAYARHEESLALRQELGDRPGIALSLHNLGSLVKDQGDYAAAYSLTEESLTISRELGDRRGMANSLGSLAIITKCRGDYASARSLYEESLGIRRELGDRPGIAESLNNLGSLVKDQGNFLFARSLTEESLTIARELGDRRSMAISLGNLGMVALEQGDIASARPLQEESLTILRQMGDRRGIASALEAFASLTAREENAERAVRLWSAAAALRETLGSVLSPTERANVEREVATVRDVLGQTAFSISWEEGRAMTWEQAAAYALGEQSEPFAV